MHKFLDILPTLFLFPIIGNASRPAFSNRDSLGRVVFSCATPCGSGWCCEPYQTCQVASAGDTPYDHTPYVCLDSLLTNNDGSPMTWPALNPTILPTNTAWISTELTLIDSAISVVEATITGIPAATTSSSGGEAQTTNSSPSMTTSIIAPTPTRNTQCRVEVSHGTIWVSVIISAFVLGISV